MNEEFLTEKERKMFGRWHDEGLLDMEKNRIRATLREHVRNTPEKTVLKSGILSWPLFSYRVSAFVLLVVVIGSGWGITKASEQSLPGEPLYAFKTQWSEPARTVFHLSPEAKASWQESRIEARLDEAKRLAAQKKLSDEDIENIETLIVKHQALLIRYEQESDDSAQESEKYPKGMKIEVKSDGEIRYRRYESEKDEREDSSDEDAERKGSSRSEDGEKSDNELEDEDGEEKDREENFQKKPSKESSKKKSSIDSNKSVKKEHKETEERAKEMEKESEIDSSEETSGSDDGDEDRDDEEQEEESDEDEEDIND